MQRLISKYGLAAHIALLAVAPLFLFPFSTPAEIATVELWLAGFGAVWVLMEPSRRSDEMLHNARMRVAAAVWRDPLFWALLLAVAFAAARWLNDGVDVQCDFNNGAPRWFLGSPRLGFLPGSAAGAGYPLFAAAVAALVLVQGCMHALGKSARIAFLFTSSALAGLAAFAAVALCVLGWKAALAQAWCGDMKGAAFVGSAFGLYLIAGMAAAAGVFECRWTRQMLLLVLSVGGNAAGLFFFAPAPVLLVYAAASLLALGVSLVYTLVHHGVTPMAKLLTALFVSLVVAVLVVMGVAFSGEKAAAGVASRVKTARLSPACEPVPVAEGELAQSAMYLACSNRVSFFAGEPLFPRHYAARSERLSALAREIWLERPWLGAGAGAFRHAMRFAADEADWKALRPQADEPALVEALRRSFGDVGDADMPGGVVPVPEGWREIGTARVETPFRGWWTLLSERGIVGALVLCALLGFLLFGYVRRFLGAFGRGAFLPGAAVGALALAALAAETFFDASMLRPEVLVAAAAFLAVSASSFPPAKRADDAAPGGKDGKNA